MKKETYEYFIKGLKSVPFGVVIGIAAGLLFGFAVGCFVCGLSTLVICEYTLSNLYIDNEAKGIKYNE
jgi:predicted patatin/cPLA2 family phospholipase